jgi:hypothetical protein
MPALVAGIHVFLLSYRKQDVDGRAFASPKVLRPRRRVKPGHDEGNGSNMHKLHVNPRLSALTPAHAATM